jgi:ankyrin repeat protein
MKRQAIFKNLNLKLVLIVLLFSLAASVDLLVARDKCATRSIAILTPLQASLIHGVSVAEAEIVIHEGDLASYYGDSLATEDVSYRLSQAARYGNLEFMREILAVGVDINLQDNDGLTALMNATIVKDKDMAQLLLTSGANSNLQNKDGITALINATTVEDKNMAKLLLTNGANPNLQDKNGLTALMNATIVKDKDMAQLLLLNRADPNLQNEDGITALMNATIIKDKDMVQLLLAKSANPNLQLSANGNTALMLAINNKNVAIVELLLNYDKIDLHIKNNVGVDAMVLIENILAGGSITYGEKTKVLQIQALFHSKLMAVEAAVAERQRANILAQLSVAMADSDRVDEDGIGATESKEN